MPDTLLYGIFAAVVAILLAVDLLVVQRDPHAVSVKEAAVWSAIWIGVSVLFGLTIPQLHDGGGQAAVAYFAGYLIEKSLSVDNVFVFVIIFSAFSVPRALQHRVLFYGVLGAIVMRTVLIFTGAALIERFHWILYVFGAFLLYLAWKTWRGRNEENDITESALMARIRRLLPTTDGYRGERFFWREQGGRLLATPLFVVLVCVEFSDLIFAVDSIPAIFGVTQDPFIVLTSNIFAIMGLRSLYFLLAGAADQLRYLNAGLAFILGFVGLKLLAESVPGLWHPNPLSSLGVIMAILAVTVVASVHANRRDRLDPARQPALKPAMVPVGDRRDTP